VSIVLALVLGFLLGVGRLSHQPVISWFCAVFVEFFRAVPVLIMMIFRLLPLRAVRRRPVEVPCTRRRDHRPHALQRCAVIAEIVRSGVNALPKGQAEAASALGLRWGQDHAGHPAAAGGHVDAAGAHLAAGGGAQGHRNRLPDHVPRDGPAGHQRRCCCIQQLHPALTVVALLMIAVNFTLSHFATVVERRLRRSKRGPAPDARGRAGHAGARSAQAPAAQSDPGALNPARSPFVS